MKSCRDVIFHNSSLYNKAAKPSDDHSPMWDDVPSVATHCLLEAVVALVARTRGLKAILLEDGGNESARVCN